MKAIRLRTEYLEEPIGLGIAAPRLYWNCVDGVKQTAYMIIAKIEDEIIWQTEKVLSGSMSHIHYEGRLLKSRDRVHWSVKLWDENNNEGEWASSWFELGLLEKNDWVAHWISGNYTPKKNIRYPADCFRKQFLTVKEIRQARLYITACGLYEARINGLRVGGFCLAPGCTDYRYRLQYQTYDVTNLLSKEQNTLEIQLADGWYRGSIGCWGAINVFGRQTKLLCQLEIRYTDGANDIILSNDSFSWSNDGPIRFADLKDGEIYDASLVPTYAERAKLVKEKLMPTASNNIEPKEHEAFSARLIHTPTGARVLDFCQNIAGFVSFTVKGKKGQKLKLRLGEILDQNGEFTQANMQVQKPVKEFGKLAEFLLATGNEKKIHGELQATPLQEIIFTCSGNTDYYKTTFSVFGFRYALIEAELSFDPSEFKAIAVYSAMEQTGRFECSNSDVNHLFRNTVWSMKGNFLDVPTDCPTRERLGWTGDAQIFFNTAAYLMNVAPFFHKWLLDLRDDQFKNGKSSAVVPYNGVSFVYDNTGGSVGWADAVVLIPYRYWKRYGDKDIISDFYGMMRNYAMYMIGHTGHKNKKDAKINPYNKYVYEKGFHLGEWLEPEEFRDDVRSPHQTHAEECTAYLHYTMSCMTEIAHVLEKKDDETLFNEYAKGAKNAYNHLFLENGNIDTDRQAKLVRPLALGLLDGEQKRNVEKRLVRAVENRGYRIGTGFLSTPFLLRMLVRAKRADIAYKMLENTDFPGWLAQVKAGATTVWEDWEGKASHNHYSPGAVCQWLFDTAAGITVDGENRFLIAPIPGGTFTFMKAKYASLYGTVSTQWQKTENGYRIEMNIPPNTTAKIQLPNKEKIFVVTGTYKFEF
jgi:alpha-L-rhamnosidase